METEHVQDREPEFDSFAEDYDAALNEGLKLSGESKDYFAEGRLLWLKRRFAERAFEPSSILDFGCGTGSATPFFFSHFAISCLIGIDPSEESLRKAREEWNEYPVSFTSSWNELDAQFDLAFCNGVFHHIPPAERPQCLRSIYNSLKPGALFSFWENNPWNPVTRYAMSRVPFDKDAILVWPRQAKSLLRSAGFEILKTDFHFFFPKSLANFRNLEPCLSRLPLGGQYLVLARKPEG